MISGRATAEGTAAYAQKRAALHAGHWRSALGLTVSSLGLGTYLGNADPVTDGKYTAAAVRALELGINVLDTAVNYRYQRSERAIGAALRQAVEKGVVARDQVVVCTKGGFIAGDLEPAGPEWFDATYLKTGVITSGQDFVANCHCMAPAYLRHEVDQSRKNLGLETIDLYHLHNPETQLPYVGADAYYARLTEAFKALEDCAAQGKIRFYGTATWQAYRVPDADPSAASLERTVACAEAAGGKDHRFRAIQLPYNLLMPEATKAETQARGETLVPAVRAAQELGLAVFTSVPLMQGKVIGRFTPDFRAKFPGLKTDAQRALQFARSTPGVAAPLCGMKSAEHVEENLRVAAVPPLDAATLEGFFRRPDANP